MKQVLRTRNKKAIHQFASQQEGQAVVEYVLLLIVTISLLMAAKSTFKNLDEFMYKFMGGYIVCLMEYGELPSKGVTNTDINNHKNSPDKTCDTKFAGFDPMTGRQPITTTSGGNSSKSSTSSSSQSASGGGKNSTDSASQASTKSADSKSKQGGSSDSNSNSSGGSNANSNSPYANGSLKRSSGADSGSIADGSSTSENAKVKVIQDDSDAGRRGQLGDDGSIRSSRRTVYDRSQYKAITGQELADIEKQNKAPRTPSTATTPIEEEGRMGPRKTTFTPPEIKPAALEKADDNQMNFGYFMKWLIIAAMAIAIFLFFGSQVMSFLNSQEK